MVKNLKIQYESSKTLTFDAEVESWFQKEWDNKLAESQKNNFLLFNGPLFHVTEVIQKLKTVELNLINTDYRTYVCSRTRHFKNSFPNLQPAMPLAACVSLISSDNKLLVEKRKGVDVHEGFYHVVGGFLDPSKDINILEIPDPYACIVREVKEETGLEIDQDKLFFLGIAEDLMVPHYELCFYSKLSLHSKQIIQKFEVVKTDGEFNTPEFIELGNDAIDSFLQAQKISPTGKVCIELMLDKIR